MKNRDLVQYVNEKFDTGCAMGDGALLALSTSLLQRELIMHKHFLRAKTTNVGHLVWGSHKLWGPPVHLALSKSVHEPFSLVQW